jgi:hypothetical protein
MSIYGSGLYGAGLFGLSGPAWQPTWQLLVAFNNLAQDDPTAISTVASPPGTLGAHNVWTDISGDVRTQGDTNRGRQHEIDQVQTGGMTVTLDNRLGKYDPWSASSPYAGKVLPGRPVRLQATIGGTTYFLFTGVTDVWATQWTAPSYSTVAVSCVDQLAYLSNAILPVQVYEQIVKADTPAGYWPLTDPAGSTYATELTGLSTRGHVANTVTFGATTPINIGQDTGCQFNGLGWIYLPLALSGTGDTTVEAWVKLTATPAASWWIYVQQDLSGFGPGGVGPALSVNNGGQAVFYGIYNKPPCVGATNIADSNWHHLVGVCNSGTGALTLYVDAVVDATSSPGTGSTQSGTIQAGIGFYPLVGADLASADVAHVAVYPLVLTSTKIANHFNNATSVPVEGSGARFTRIASTWMKMPVGTVDAGSSQLQAITTPPGQTSGLSYLQNVEQSEAGLMYVDTSGHLTFKGRTTVYGTTTSTATFGDNPGEMPWELGPQVATDTQDVYGYISVQRTNGNTQTVAVPNANQFGAKTLTIGGLLNTTDQECFDMANWFAIQFATPRPRIRQITVRPVSDLTGATTAALLALEIGAVVTVNRHNVPGGGTAFSQVCNVEGINWHIYPDTGDFNVDLQLTPLSPIRPWILGTSTLGVDTYLFF